MTREIKFRGLRIDGKGWVYGSLVNNLWVYSENSIYHKLPVCDIIIDGECNDYYEMESNDQNISVIPKSVGQFTGLKDKNGVEIYEGDLIAQPFFKSLSDFTIGKVFTVPVFYNIDSTGFDIDILKVARPYSTFTPFEDCEVIGNIHQESEVTNGI